MQIRRCQAVHPETGKRCEHKQGHIGPHRLFRRRSEAEIVTWEDPPLDPKEIVGIAIDERGLVAYTRDKAGDFINAVKRTGGGLVDLLRRDDGTMGVIEIDDPSDAVEGGGAGTVKATHGEPLDAETVRRHRVARCWSCGCLPVVVHSQRGYRAVCPRFADSATACRRSLRAHSRRELWFALSDWNMRQKERA